MLGSMIRVSLLIVSLLQLSITGWAHSQQYTAEEYRAYEQATSANRAIREDAIVEFVRTYPNSDLVEYAVGSYLQLMQTYQNAGQSRKVFLAGEKLLAVQPNELNTLYMTAIGAYQLQKFDKATVYGEKVYSQKPNAGLAFVLATSYGQLGDDGEVLFYGEKACAELKPKDCYQIWSSMAKISAKMNLRERAARYAEEAIIGIHSAEKPPQTPLKEWNDYINIEKANMQSILDGGTPR